MTEEEPVFPLTTAESGNMITEVHMAMWLQLAHVKNGISLAVSPWVMTADLDCPVLTRLGYLAKPSKSKSRYVLTDKGKAWLVAYIMEHGSVE